jgi:hypothetical protein
VNKCPLHGALPNYYCTSCNPDFANYKNPPPVVRGHDPVNRPLHYTNGAIECIDAIESAIVNLNGVEGFLTGQVIKYMWRWKAKGGAEDLRKAQWYLNRLLQYITPPTPNKGG